MKVLNELIDLFFKSGDGESYLLMANRLIGQKKEGQDFVVFTKNSLKKTVKYLL